MVMTASKIIVEHENPRIAHGLINGQMFIDGQPLEDWLDDFLPDRDLKPNPHIFGYCKRCRSPLSENDFFFWSILLESDTDFENHCVPCLTKLAEVSQ